MDSDFVFSNHGSLWMCRPMNDDATAWLAEHTDGQWLGDSLAVEPRYVEGLALGIAEAGMTAEVLP
jgi:hypothetical protein